MPQGIPEPSAEILRRLAALERKVNEDSATLTTLTGGQAGLTLRYGFVQAVTGAEGSIAVAYSTPFPTGTAAVVAVTFENAGVSEVALFEVQGVTKAGFTGFYNSGVKKVGIMYIAIGF